MQDPVPRNDCRPTLTVENVAVARGGRLVVHGIAFRLGPGGALVLGGRNGSGKSSLLRALAGLLPLQSGAARLEGGLPQATLSEQLHYLGHADGLKTALTAGENLRVAAALLASGSWRPEMPAVAALALVGLEALHDLPVGYLSAGQRRRVALARLAVAPRPLWLLDEPATALDRDAQEGLARLMARHRASGGLVVAATHAPLGLEGALTLRLGPDGPP